MPSAKVVSLLAALTDDEAIMLVSGKDFWTTEPIERLGIPSVKVTDGPNGARGGGGLIGGVTAAAFPAAIGLAATWDTSLLREIGAALAKEVRSKGARVSLAPTVNLHRSSLNGRNFECYSEDPFLTAEIAVAYIEGMQANGVGATIKHFVGNESEYQRMSMSSDIDARTLRELYLVPFEAAVKRAETAGIMTSYNSLNGKPAGECGWLLKGIARGEWGFDGLFMSDWFGTYSTAAALKAGQDLEMPGPGRWRREKLRAALASGEVSSADIRAAAEHVLAWIERVGAFASPEIETERAEDLPQTRALIRRAGADGAVLLKNDGVLPIASPGRIAAIGPNAATARIMGGGSAQLNPHYSISPVDGLKAAQSLHNSTIEHALGCANDRLVPLHDKPWRVEYFANLELSGEPAHVETLHDGQFMHVGAHRGGFDTRRFSCRLTTTVALAEDTDYDFGVVATGPTRLKVDGATVVDDSGWKVGNEYFDNACDEMRAVRRLAKGEREVVVEFRTPDDTGVMQFSALRPGVSRVVGDAEMEEAVALAKASDVALVFVGLNGEWDSEGKDRPNLQLPGRQNELVARVAAVNPKTVVVLQSGAPIVMPWLDQVAAVLQCWYPGQEAGNAIADVLTGAAEPGGRLPQTFPARLDDDPTRGNYPGVNGHVAYAEGVFIGYRHYEAKAIAPLFAFGHGLSYARFALSGLTLSAAALGDGQDLKASAVVTNVGEREGATVVQFYVTDDAASVARPPKELKGFVKARLKPGESRTVSVTLDRRALAFFDSAREAWVAERGAFALLAGFSSADIKASAKFSLEKEWIDDAPRRAREAFDRRG